MNQDFKYNDEEARKYISLIFDGYKKRKVEGRLYAHDGIPELIIKIYYSYVKKPSFSKLLYNFKRRYIYNENKVEQVHSKEEQEGLGLAYDYINKKDINNISIYDLSYIHEALYSKTPYPSFGGKYRNEERYLIGRDENNNIMSASIELTPYWNITHEMNLLKPVVEELVEEGISLGKDIDSEKLIDYIGKCVVLKCKLIKIHPFGDGNGRAIRAFINLLFRLANIPPVYIENREKFKYQTAMNKALIDGDYSDITSFYLYKICDSIIALDVNIKEQEIKYIDSGIKSKNKGVK